MTRMDAWMFYVVAALLLVAVVVLVGVLLNVHKMLSKVSAIRREVDGVRESGASAHLVEAVAQLQSVAVSLDRIAARCDSIGAKLDSLAERSPQAASADMTGVAAAIRESLAGLAGPVAEIRDRLARSEIEHVADEVRRMLYARGFDGVTILNDLATLAPQGEARVQVEVVREGVKSKGWVLLRDGAAVESKISPTYEMFP